MTTILVVEDNALTRKMLRLALVAAGYAVLEAEDGATALALASRNLPALVLMDLGLPDFDGLELLRWLREIPGIEDIPILALTGKLPDPSTHDPRGFTEALLKPVEPSRLVAMVHDLLRAPTPIPAERHERRRVLLAQEDPVHRRVLRLGLQSWGYEVSVVTDGVEALDASRSAVPDVVVADVLLPELDGLSLCRAIRGDRTLARVPVVLVTASPFDDVDLGTAYDAGVNAVWSRTPSLSELRRTLIAVLRRPPEPEPHSDPMSTPDGDSLRLVARLQKEAVVSDALGESQAVSSALLSFFERYSRLMMEGGDADKMIDDLLASTLDASGASCGAAYLVVPDGGLVLRGQIGYPEWAHAELADCFGAAALLEHLLALGVPVEIPSADHPRTHGIDALLECAQARALVFVPLTFGAEAIGILVLGAQREAATSHRLRMAEAIRGPIAQAVALSRTLAKLVSSQQVYRGITESTSDAILVADRGVVTYANPAAGNLFGCRPYNLAGRGIRNLLPFIGPGEVACGGSARRDDGIEVPVMVSIGTFEGAPGQLLETYVARDLSLRRTLDALAALANRDMLTDLFNRRWFEEHLRTRLAEAERYAHNGALLMIDLDDFKPVNDRFGHSAGDAVLKRVAAILTEITRESDSVARIGGDEFAVELPHTTCEEALFVANKLVTALSDPIGWRDETLKIGASVGVALYPRDGRTPAALFEVADLALYRAKNGGRNMVCSRVAS